MISETLQQVIHERSNDVIRRLRSLNMETWNTMPFYVLVTRDWVDFSPLIFGDSNNGCIMWIGYLAII